MNGALATILIVEDEGIVLRDVEHVLQGFGYRHLSATSAEEALARAAETLPDLALVDIRLAGESDGVATAVELLRRFGVPTVFVTAHGDDDTVQRAKLARPLGFLLKPYSPEQLRSMVEISLYRHAADRRVRAWEDWFSSAVGALGTAPGPEVMAAVLDSAPGGVVLEDEQRRIGYANQAFCAMFALPVSPSALLGSSGAAASERSRYLFADPEQFVEGLAAIHATRQPVSGEVIPLVSGRVYERDCAPVRIGGAYRGMYAIYRDVTEREQRSASRARELRNQALYDELTGLLNRRGFFQEGDAVLANAGKRGRPVVMVMADVDGLKRINDEHGHGAGDDALRVFGATLRDCLRGCDVVARIGGDEFAALVLTGGADTDAKLLARLRGRLGPMAPIPASVGVVPYVAGRHASLGDLLAEADAAMYADKRGKRRSTTP